MKTIPGTVAASVVGGERSEYTSQCGGDSSHTIKKKINIFYSIIFYSKVPHPLLLG
jgi:hypothetical protein